MATKESKAVQKSQETQSVEGTRNVQTFSPYTDIIENDEGLTLLMDIPGVTDKNLDIHLEDNVLSVHARVDDVAREGYKPLYTEYAVGDFQRSFRLIEDFDADKITAELKNGVLTIFLPKSEKQKPRKITVKSSS